MMQFTYAAYRELIALLKAQNYRFCGYFDHEGADKRIILRHDIDYSMERAFKLAQVEQAIIDLQAAVMELHKAKQKRGISASEYAERIREYSMRMEELEAQQEELQTTENRHNQIKVWLDNFIRHIQSGKIMNTDDSQIMKQLVEQIIVGADSMEI